jgi:hypothetical protein
MLSASPLESQGFRTIGARPTNPGFTDRLLTVGGGDEPDNVQKGSPNNSQNDSLGKTNKTAAMNLPPNEFLARWRPVTR